MRANLGPVLLLGLVVLGGTACGGDDDGGATADGSGPGFPDSRPGGVDAPPGGTDGGGPAGDAPPLGTTQRTCAFRVRFTDTTSTLEGECRAYTPVLDRFRSVTAGACRFTADESLGMGTTVVGETGVVTATGAALPAAPVMATANPVGHYARTETFVMANVGDAIAVSSTGGAVPAIPEVSVTRPTTLIFDDRPANAVSRAAGWTVAHQAAGAGELRVVISQNMGNVYKQAVCVADATATSLVVPPEITGEFFIGTAFAAFERVDQTLTTAGDYAVTVDTQAEVQLAAGGALTGMSITFAD